LAVRKIIIRQRFTATLRCSNFWHFMTRMWIIRLSATDVQIVADLIPPAGPSAVRAFRRCGWRHGAVSHRINCGGNSMPPAASNNPASRRAARQDDASRLVFDDLLNDPLSRTRGSMLRLALNYRPRTKHPTVCSNKEQERAHGGSDYGDVWWIQEARLCNCEVIDALHA